VAPELRRAASEPVRAPRRGTFLEGSFVHVAFDGGASKGGEGTAGFVIINKHGQEVVRRGMVLGPGLTNNEAESAACLAAL
jgi:ribonuclease HI